MVSSSAIARAGRANIMAASRIASSFFMFGFLLFILIKR
jgi:hypothetical protein